MSFSVEALDHIKRKRTTVMARVRASALSKRKMARVSASVDVACICFTSGKELQRLHNLSPGSSYGSLNMNMFYTFNQFVKLGNQHKVLALLALWPCDTATSYFFFENLNHTFNR